MLLHHSFIRIGRRTGIPLRNGVVMPAVANDCRFERADELCASLQSFLDRFRAARVMIARVDAILIDRGSGAQDAERIEQADRLALLGQPNSHRRPINPRTYHRYFGAHSSLRWMPNLQKLTARRLALERCSVPDAVQ